MNSVCPLYQAEVAPTSIRGKMVGIHATMLVAGLATSIWVSLGCFFIANPQLQWRLNLAIRAIPAILLLSGSFWLMESPRWLILNQQSQLALDVLAKMQDREHLDVDVADQIRRIADHAEIDGQHETGFFKLLIQRHTRNRLLLGFFIMFVNQATGQNVLYSYQVNTLATVGITGWKGILVLAAYLSYAAGLNWINALLLDRYGRRQILLIALVSTNVLLFIQT